jgi:hypothetical protein
MHIATFKKPLAEEIASQILTAISLRLSQQMAMFSLSSNCGIRV